MDFLHTYIAFSAFRAYFQHTEMETQQLAWIQISSIGRMAKNVHSVRTILLLYFNNFYRTTQLNMPDSKRFTVWCLHEMFEVMSDRVVVKHCDVHRAPWPWCCPMPFEQRGSTESSRENRQPNQTPFILHRDSLFIHNLIMPWKCLDFSWNSLVDRNGNDSVVVS